MNSLVTKKTYLFLAVAAACFNASGAIEVKKNEAEASLDEPVEKIVVYGRKQADILAISDKRDAKNIIEAISQDDLGNLPDNNLGESLGRIAGVSTVLDEGVGRYISIRGLKPEFINVSVDGSGIASAARTFDENGGRATNMEALDADFIGKIEVFKSVSADMDGDAIGGSVNFVSRSAFDLKDDQQHFTVLSGAIGQNTSDEIPFSKNDNDIKLKLSHLHQFGSDDEFGLVVTATTKNENKDIIKQGVHYWNGSETPSAAPYDGLVFEDKEKLSGSLKLEYQPTIDLYSFASVILSDESSSWDKNEHMVWGGISNSSESLNNGLALVQQKVSDFGTDSISINAGADWFIDFEHYLEVRVSSSDSRSYLDEKRVQWVGESDLKGSYSKNGRSYDYQLDAVSNAKFGDKSNYNLGDVRYKNNEAEQKEDAIKVDWSFNDNDEPGAWGAKSGFKYKSKRYNFIETYARSSDYVGSDQYQDVLSSYAYQSPSSNTNLLAADLNAMAVQVSGFENFVTSELFQNQREFYDNAKDYNSEENVTAIYGLATYTADNYDARFGLRYEQTDYKGSNRKGSQQDAELETNAGSYSDLLPSAQINYRLGGDIQLRAAYSKTLGRPNMDQYVYLETTPNVNTGVYYVSSGNLKPRESSNFDLAGEYYFDDGSSLLSIGYFSKDIKNEIIEEQVSYTYQVDDITSIPSYYLQTANAGKGKVSGFEFSFIKTQFEFLPDFLSGIGINANATLQKGELEQNIDSNGTIRLLDMMPNAPEEIYNISITYDTDTVNTRLAWQYSSEKLLNIANQGKSEYDLIRQPTKRLDFYIGYDVTANVNLALEIFNLTNEKISDEGYGYWDESTVYGRSVWLNTKVKF